MLKTCFIKHDFNLPDHSNELLMATEIIQKIKNKLKQIKKIKNINDKTYEQLYEETIRILDYIGNLSMSVFKVEEEIERMYTMQFQHSPQLGKKLCNDHYTNIHHPYSLLKNRCFKLLDDLDDEYIKRNKRKPPNWNI